MNNNFPYDNSLLVLDMVLRSLWGTTQPINWENVARLVPGFTPKEVIKKYNVGHWPRVRIENGVMGLEMHVSHNGLSNRFLSVTSG